MRITINKKIVIILLMITMTLWTISGAAATNLTINGHSGTNWKRLADDLVVTNNDTYELSYYDSTGLDKTIDTTPYLAIELVAYGITPSNSIDYGIIDEEDIVFLASDKKIVIVDYSTGNIVTRDQSGVLNYSYDNTYNILGITDDAVYFTYTTDSSDNLRVSGVSIYTSNTLISSSGLLSSQNWGCHYSDNRNCAKVFIEETSSNIFDVVTISQIYLFGNDIINRVFRITINETNLSAVTLTRPVYVAPWRPNKYDANSYLNDAACYEDNYNIYCTGSGNEYSYDKTTLTKSTGTDKTINDFYIDYDMTDDNGLNELYIASNNSVYVYDGTTHELLTAGTGYTASYPRQFREGIILDDAVIYRTSGTFTWQFSTLDELTLAVGYEVPEEIENVTYITTNSTNNFTGSDFRAMKLIENNQVLIGGSIFGTEGFMVIEYNDTENILVGDSGVETDTVYSIDSKPNSSPIKISVGTDEGIHSLTYTYTYYIEEIKNETTNETIQNITHLDSLFNYRTRDRWNDLFHQDDAYDVLTIDYDNYVCDSDDDELDYNDEFNDPTDLASTQCYDIERHGNYLYVDTGSAGINVYNATAITSVTYLNHIDIRSTTHGLLYGDLMDIDDDTLIAIEDEDRFVAYNISDDSSETIIATCNVAGAGVINSVEYFNSGMAMAGLQNGKVAVCDLNGTEGTNVVVYEPITSSDIMAIEYDGALIHIIAGDEYIISTIESYEINTTTNTPPNITSYEISDTTPEINQTVTVTITAGNIEPLDVIRYGIKCTLNDTNYTYNLLGQFECLYTTAGSEQITVAVTDNYHLDTWYDESSTGITVLPTVFTGGIINVEVIDDDTTEYVVGANVTADGNSVLTDSFGRATITTTNESEYLVVTIANDYYTNSITLLADGSYYVVRMNLVGATNQTNLIVTVEDDQTLAAIEGALVSYTNYVTYNYEYTFSDVNGRAIFTDVDTGLTVIQASGTDYDSNDLSTTITPSTTNEITISLTKITGAFTGTSTNRSCVDDGLWICGDAKIVQHSCTVDSDCELTDYCTAGLNTCSRFNYSRCDEIGMPRTQRCIAKLSGEGIMTNITNFMLSNLLWVIILLIIFISMGMLFISWKGK